MFSYFRLWNNFEYWSVFYEVKAYKVKAYKKVSQVFGPPCSGYCVADGTAVGYSRLKTYRPQIVSGSQHTVWTFCGHLMHGLRYRVGELAPIFFLSLEKNRPKNCEVFVNSLTRTVYTARRSGESQTLDLSIMRRRWNHENHLAGIKATVSIWQTNKPLPKTPTNRIKACQWYRVFVKLVSTGPTYCPGSLDTSSGTPITKKICQFGTAFLSLREDQVVFFFIPVAPLTPVTINNSSSFLGLFWCCLSVLMFCVFVILWYFFFEGDVIVMSNNVTM